MTPPGSYRILREPGINRVRVDTLESLLNETTLMGFQKFCVAKKCVRGGARLPRPGCGP